MQRFRIGGVPFGVGAPLVAGLAGTPYVELVRDVPTGLIARLRRGELDAALASSIEAFRTPGYRVLADIGIASREQVRSVRLFLRGDDPRAVRDVGIDAGSESSFALLRLWLEQHCGVSGCRYRRVEPRDDPLALPHDAVLLIGDHGLHARSDGGAVIDLGAAWRQWTGLPFVFALWLIRPGADADPLAATLRAAAAGARPTGGEGVHYRLDADDRRGLQRFAAEAARLGLADPAVQPTFLHPPTGIEQQP